MRNSDIVFKVIIAGSRNYNNYDFVKHKLDILFSKMNCSIEIVSGGAEGVDKLGERYSREALMKEPTLFKAQWDDIEDKPSYQIKLNCFGKVYWTGAGMHRNSQMADYADALVAFNLNNSKGTANMVKQAKEKGLQVREYHVE